MPSSGAHQHKDLSLLEQVQRKVIIRAWSTSPLRELRLFSPEKRRLWENHIANFQNLREAYKRAREGPFYKGMKC